jgi:hypothetical protein
MQKSSSSLEGQCQGEIGMVLEPSPTMMKPAQ